MKTIKLILTTLLFLASFAAEAQNVVIYKDGNIVREYTAEQVDSVVYVPATERRKFYYYLGTVKPTDDTFIEENGTVVYSKDDLKDFVIETDEYVYFCYPAEWGTAIITDGAERAPGKSVLSLSNVNLTKYNGWRFNTYNQGMHYYITFPE